MSVRLRVVGLASLFALVGVMVVGGTVASAGTLPCGDGTFSQTGSTATCSYASTGSEDTFTVPAGVTQLQVSAVGGAGGPGGYSTTGGEGAVVTGDLTVTSSEVLYVEVGGNGSSGGFNGGGAAGSGCCTEGNGGDGGGASDVRTVASTSSGSLSSRLLVAGGGGGGGGYGSLGNGGAAGNAGQDVGYGTAVYGGGAGGSATGGSPGDGGYGGQNGQQGSLGTGGAGGNAGGSAGGGGGGGGYYGGGGGGGGGGYPVLLCSGCGAGGGGGSDLVPADGTSGLTSNAASVAISWSVPAVTITTPPAVTATYTYGQVVDASYSCTAGAGLTLSTCVGPVANVSPINTTTVGSNSFTVTATDTDGQSTSVTHDYNVTVLPPTVTLTTPPSGTPTYTYGQVVDANYSCTAGGGSTLSSCVGPVGSGSPINTTTLGSNSFKVTATDADGQTTSVTNNYDVVAASTSLRAWPQLVELEPFVGVGSQTVEATLTSGGSPVSGQTVYFTEGSTALCHATTNGAGVARCYISANNQSLLYRTNHYTATFPGTPDYAGSTSTTLVVTFIL
jgi:hypothetical protein